MTGLVLGHFINHFAALVIVGGTNCGMKRLAVQAFGVRILMIFRLSMYKIGTSSFMFASSMLRFCTSTEVLKWQEQSVYSKRKMAIGAIGFPSLLMERQSQEESLLTKTAASFAPRVKQLRQERRQWWRLAWSGFPSLPQSEEPMKRFLKNFAPREERIVRIRPFASKIPCGKSFAGAVRQALCR